MPSPLDGVWSQMYNWEAIGAIGEILGAIAVVSTLAYLAVQIRESRTATAADIYQTRAATRADSHFHLALNCPTYHETHSKFLAEASSHGVDAALASLSDHERFLVGQYFAGVAALIDNACFQYKRGFLSELYYSRQTKGGIRQLGPIWRALELRVPPDLADAMQEVSTEDDA